MLGMSANVKLCCNCCLICVDDFPPPPSFVELFMGLHVWWLCGSGSGKFSLRKQGCYYFVILGFVFVFKDVSYLLSYFLKCSNY